MRGACSICGSTQHVNTAHPVRLSRPSGTCPTCGKLEDNIARTTVLIEGVGVTRCCPSRGLAVLGFVEPIHVPCSLVEGHDDDHRFGPVTWSSAAKETP